MALVLRSKTTKVLVSRTLESVPGAAEFIDPRMENGKLVFDYTGGTDMWWDDQFTQDNKEGNRYFIDDNGHVVTEDELELVEEENEKDQGL